MVLHIKDRIYISQLLPEKTNFMGYNLKRNILKKIAISNEDFQEYGIKTHEGGKITWNMQYDKEHYIDVDFTQDEISFLKHACEQISADEAYSDDFWEIVENIYNATSVES